MPDLLAIIAAKKKQPDLPTRKSGCFNKHFIRFNFGTQSI